MPTSDLVAELVPAFLGFSQLLARQISSYLVPGACFRNLSNFYVVYFLKKLPNCSDLILNLILGQIWSLFWKTSYPQISLKPPNKGKNAIGLKCFPTSRQFSVAETAQSSSFWNKKVMNTDCEESYVCKEEPVHFWAHNELKWRGVLNFIKLPLNQTWA